MLRTEEPEWMRKARQAPLRSTWDSRNEHKRDRPLSREPPAAKVIPIKIK